MINDTFFPEVYTSKIRDYNQTGSNKSPIEIYELFISDILSSFSKIRFESDSKNERNETA